MAWIILIASGVLESVWATALGASKNFTKWKPTALFALTLILSMAGLSYAMGTIAVGTAYAVWVGIGAALTVIFAIARKNEPLYWPKIALLIVLVGSIIGLKAVS